MGSETTSNQNLAIVTNKTKHVATNTGTDDPCLDVNKDADGKQSNFKNYIESTQLAANKTTKTLIDGANIMHKETRIGPPSKGDNPLWEFPMASGRGAGCINQEVWAHKSSQDVKAEGEFVIRTDDETCQNANNSKGKMDGSNLDGDEDTVADYAKLKCSMDWIKGTSGSRQLGPEKAGSKRKDYLEILDGEEVELECQRFDGTDTTGQPAINPECELVPDHSHWVAKRTGVFDLIDETEEGETFKITKSLTNFPGSSERSLGESDTLSEQGEELAFGEDRPNYDNVATKKEVSATVTADWGAILAHLRFWAVPVFINVEAFACTGSEKAKIRIFPADPIKWSVELGGTSSGVSQRGSQRGRAQSIGALANVNRFFGAFKSVIEKVSKIVGCADVELQWKFMVGFKMEAEVGYAHKKQGLTNHVGLCTKIVIACDPFMEFAVEVEISVLQLVTTFIGAGVVSRVIKKIEDAIGVPLQLVFTASIGVGVDYEVQRDQDDQGSSSGNLRIKPALSVALRIQLDKAEASMGGRLAGEVRVAAHTSGTHFGKLITTGKLTCTAWVEGKVKGRILWIGPEYDIGGKKEFKLFETEAVEFGSIDFIERGTKSP